MDGVPEGKKGGGRKKAVVTQHGGEGRGKTGKFSEKVGRRGVTRRGLYKAKKAN